MARTGLHITWTYRDVDYSIEGPPGDREIVRGAIGPQKTRNAISWTPVLSDGDAIIGFHDGADVAVIRATIVDDAGEIVPRFRASIRDKSRVFEKASAAKAWCEGVLNGDEE